MNLALLPPANWMTEYDCSTEQIDRIVHFLTEQGTFQFPTLPNGLFSAAASIADDFEVTGYQHVWVRDNVQIAQAYWEIGETAAAARTAESLMSFFVTHHPRWSQAVTGDTDPHQVMNRPHIRFDGRANCELEENWSHAQNDALGYFVWLYARLYAIGAVHPGIAAWTVLSDLVHFWERVRFWEDEDSGHWEEIRKVSASSIGTATAGLRELRRVWKTTEVQTAPRTVTIEQLDRLIRAGETALSAILPHECVQADPGKSRAADAALLFLIDPLEVVSGTIEDQILNNVVSHLLGPHGVRRYRGDSYWCANYKTLLTAESRTADVSDDMSQRDQLLQPGQEAQWCIFDPILSCIYGRRFQQNQQPTDFSQQIYFLRRALGQITRPGSRFGAYRCPESYYLEGSAFVPNDITPLLWTQANLRRALHSLRRSAEKKA